MSIETQCPGCGKTLEIGAEHAGKQARCPMCNEIYTVPLADEQTPQEEGGEWRLRTPEGQTYGPVKKSELDEWVAEGRVSSDCVLSSDVQPDWVSAELVYSELASPAPRQTAAQAAPMAHYISPHRGGLILALGIMSWASCCPIFGIFAWVMGNADLGEMRAGRMDRSGSGLTQSGQVIGMIHALIGVIASVVIVFLLLLGYGWR